MYRRRKEEREKNQIYAGKEVGRPSILTKRVAPQEGVKELELTGKGSSSSQASGVRRQRQVSQGGI